MIRKVNRAIHKIKFRPFLDDARAAHNLISRGKPAPNFLFNPTKTFKRKKAGTLKTYGNRRMTRILTPFADNSVRVTGRYYNLSTEQTAKFKTTKRNIIERKIKKNNRKRK